MCYYAHKETTLLISRENKTKMAEKDGERRKRTQKDYILTH